MLRQIARSQNSRPCTAPTKEKNGTIYRNIPRLPAKKGMAQQNPMAAPPSMNCHQENQARRRKNRNAGNPIKKVAETVMLATVIKLPIAYSPPPKKAASGYNKAIIVRAAATRNICLTPR